MSAFKLVEVERNGNGGGDYHRTKAVSNDEEKLKEYCKEKYNKEVGEPENFTWDDYYIIVERHDLVIL